MARYACGQRVAEKKFREPPALIGCAALIGWNPLPQAPESSAAAGGLSTHSARSAAEGGGPAHGQYTVGTHPDGWGSDEERSDNTGRIRQFGGEGVEGRARELGRDFGHENRRNRPGKGL
eukprot:364747-Chlamydomonas_euryale.AAC.1